MLSITPGFQGSYFLHLERTTQHSLLGDVVWVDTMHQISAESAGGQASGAAVQGRSRITHFFDLPREVRDKVYIHFPDVAWVDITLYPWAAKQPTVSEVCRQMRKESLEVYYSKYAFMIDMRGWKHSSYPRRWTPKTILNRWATAIRDTNIMCLRKLIFVSRNFSALITKKDSKLTLKFRTNTTKAEVAEGLPSNYTFHVAAQRCTEHVQHVVDDVNKDLQGGPLTVDDVKLLYESVEQVQPFLCTRNSLGSWGAVLMDDDNDHWPSSDTHLMKCDECGYHRFTRGTD